MAPRTRRSAKLTAIGRLSADECEMHFVFVREECGVGLDEHVRRDVRLAGAITLESADGVVLVPRSLLLCVRVQSEFKFSE